MAFLTGLFAAIVVAAPPLLAQTSSPTALPAPSPASAPSPSSEPTPSSAPSPAQTSTPAPRKAALSTIGSVSSTAERYTSPLSSTAQAVYVVGHAQIEQKGYHTVAEAIRTVPGMTFYQYGAFGAMASFGTMGSMNSIVLLNGVPINEGSNGGIDLGTLSATGVDRIEVVESGGSTLYGSGGSGGVINIITSVPRATYLAASYGSYGDRAVRVSAGTGTIGFTFERHIATNDYPYRAQNGFPTATRVNAQARQSAGSIEYGQSFGAWSIRATARLSKLDLGVPGPVAYSYGASELTPDAFDPSNRNDLSARIGNLRGKFSTSLTLSGFRQALFDNNDGRGPEDAVFDSRTNLALAEVVSQSMRNTLVAGLDLSRETLLDVTGINGPPPAFDAAQSQAALYAQQAIGIGPSGKAYAGLRAENDRPAGTILNPSVGFQLPAGPVRAALNLASSFIVPTLYDLYYPNYSNPHLLPERDRNLNLVLTGRTSFLNPKLMIFDRVATNLITSDANFIPYNAGRAHFQGAVLSVGPHVGPFAISASFTDLPVATQVAYGVAGRVGYEPIMQGTLSVDRDFGRGNLAYGISAQTAGAHLETYAGAGTFGQYTTVDAYVRGRFAHRGILTARVNNLGDRYYELFHNYPVPARTWRIEYANR